MKTLLVVPDKYYAFIMYSFNEVISMSSMTIQWSSLGCFLCLSGGPYRLLGSPGCVYLVGYVVPPPAHAMADIHGWTGQVGDPC